MLIRNGLQLRCVVWVLRGCCVGLRGVAWGCVWLRGAAWGCVGLRGAAWGGATVLDHRYIMNQHTYSMSKTKWGRNGKRGKK